MTISIVIVSYNVKEFLHQCILSLKDALKNIDNEIIIVDNNSVDGSDKIIKYEFPEIKLIANKENLGFAKGCNQGMQIAEGKYLLLLNPDTMVQEDTFTTMIDFFETNPETGAAGCKILNPDGTLQLACRRSFPSPKVAIPKLLGLSRLFPKSKMFGKYNMTYEDPEKLTEVEAVSGSFLMVRKEIFEQIGGFDEAFFMYGEDLDYCYRIKEKGWRIFYVPYTKIIHYKGESAKLAAFDSFITFYKAMDIFVNKHFTKGYYFFIDIIFKMGIFFRGSVSLIANFFKKYLIMLVDGTVITGGILAAHVIQTPPLPSYRTLISMLIFYLLLWLGLGYTVGLYERKGLSYSHAAVASTFSFIFSMFIHFMFKGMIYSPEMIILSLIMVTLLLPGWRIFLILLQRKRIIPPSSFLSKALLSRRTILIGSGEEGERIAKKLQAHIEHGFEILGFVDREFIPKKVSGFPSLGSIGNLPEIIRIHKATEVIFTTDRFSNDEILMILDKIKETKTNIKIVPKNLDFILGKSSVEKIEDIPLVEVEYNIFYASNHLLKRLFDLLISLIGILIFFPCVIPYALLSGCQIKKKKYLGSNRKIFTGLILERKNGNDIRKNLRRFPLILSVLKGDMSMVGAELLYGNFKERHLRCKPGITGLFQVQGNHKPNEVDKQNYEHYYMRNYSLFLDIEILLKAILRI